MFGGELFIAEIFIHEIPTVFFTALFIMTSNFNKSLNKINCSASFRFRLIRKRKSRKKKTELEELAR